ncbi:MAG: DNA recombination/repair protein RecA, partial [Pseudomonadota bacterium]
AKTFLRENSRIAYEIEDKIRASHGLDFDMPPPGTDDADDVIEA